MPKPPISLTESDQRAIAALDYLCDAAHDRTFTCSELGEYLYSDGHRKPQCYARPAGKVIKRLLAMGYVARSSRGEGRHRRDCYGRTGRYDSSIKPTQANHRSPFGPSC